MELLCVRNKQKSIISTFFFKNVFFKNQKKLKSVSPYLTLIPNDTLIIIMMIYDLSFRVRFHGKRPFDVLRLRVVMSDP